MSVDIGKLKAEYRKLFISLEDWRKKLSSRSRDPAQKLTSQERTQLKNLFERHLEQFKKIYEKIKDLPSELDKELETMKETILDYIAFKENGFVNRKPKKEAASKKPKKESSKKEAASKAEPQPEKQVDEREVAEYRERAASLENQLYGVVKNLESGPDEPDIVRQNLTMARMLIDFAGALIEDINSKGLDISVGGLELAMSDAMDECGNH